MQGEYNKTIFVANFNIQVCLLAIECIFFQIKDGDLGRLIDLK